MICFANRKLLLLTLPATSKMSNTDLQDFIQQNRAVADQVETFRGYWESEKHWQARKEFLLRNINDFPEPSSLNHLLSLSMVWANNVFLGCRYVNKTCFSGGHYTLCTDLICLGFPPWTSSNPCRPMCLPASRSAELEWSRLNCLP